MRQRLERRPFRGQLQAGCGLCPDPGGCHSSGAPAQHGGDDIAHCKPHTCVGNVPLNCKRTWYQHSTHLIAVRLGESGEANGQQGLTATREAAQTLVEGCSGFPDAPKFGLFRSVHKIAHDRQERAAWADSFRARHAHSVIMLMNAQTSRSAQGPGQAIIRLQPLCSLTSSYADVGQCKKASVKDVRVTWMLFGRCPAGRAA